MLDKFGSHLWYKNLSNSQMISKKVNKRTKPISTSYWNKEKISLVLRWGKLKFGYILPWESGRIKSTYSLLFKYFCSLSKLTQLLLLI